MRNALSETLVRYASDPNFVFLTGDLGFMALEPLQAALGSRFINMGVAEQNMISVAAGLAQNGLSPWTYSIAPFVYARPFEQIRNDVCFHNLAVRLIGNGGGYAYGVMGATHHALEDYGSLLCLSGMRAYVPAFNTDISPIVRSLFEKQEHPAYLRMGRDEKPADFTPPPYTPWRNLLEGSGPTMLVVGPLVGTYIESFTQLPATLRPDLWVLTELPLQSAPPPDGFLASLQRSQHLFVVEEHVAQGGAGQMLAHYLLCLGRAPARFTHRFAQGYVSGRYGSQRFHRAESGLDASSLCAELANGIQ